MTEVERKSARVDGDRIATEVFAQVFRGYLECSDEVQAAIRDMVEVVTADDATDDEREAALSTITEALFPGKRSIELGIDLEDADASDNYPDRAVVEELNDEETSFAERLSVLLEHRGMTQGELAHAIGVGQPAVSMMLARNCRPQRRTVEKIAEALNIPVEELWPGTKHNAVET